MIAVELSPDEEQALAHHARARGRPTNVVAREWILARLKRERDDELIRNSAALTARDRAALVDRAGGDATDSWLRLLDAEDGGYDWGPDGPPA